MIDTDKYEGHTPGPWWIDKVSDNGETNTWLMGNAPQDDMLFCIEFAEGNDADVRLIAAAPDLLAEVKRLRDFIQSVWDGLGEAGRSDTYELFKDEWGIEE